MKTVPVLIEDYGLIGDLQTAALVGRDGSIDWLCLPRFDSASCFTALLGEPKHGRWLLAPATGVRASTRRYRPGTLVLETDLETTEGAVRVIDFMPRRGEGPPQVVRIVEGLHGRVPMRSELVVRPDYGSIAPWVETVADGALIVAGPDAFHLSTPRELHVADATATAAFTAVEGSREPFVMSWHPSTEASPRVESADSALARTEAWWREWSARCTYDGAHSDAVRTSLVVLKAMTARAHGRPGGRAHHLPAGGHRRGAQLGLPLLLAARLGADARSALLTGGYVEEAQAFQRFVFRSVPGDPASLQIMYGLGGERRLTEFELPHLPGYEGSRPVRIGNAASEQFQLDVYGEVVAAAYAVRERLGQPPDPRVVPRWRALIEHVGRVWREPDDGIWEARGPRRHFTHSKVMAWVAADRAARLADQIGGPMRDRWRGLRDEIHAEVCERAWDSARRTFTQYYGSAELDAAVLMIPIVGFLPGDDDRVTGTIDAVQRELGHDGFVARYSTAHTDDGLPGGEGQFLACSFWLVSALAMNGRAEEARALFERLLALRNDLGLLAEEYDVPRARQVGNFPQAFSHLALIQAASLL